MSALGGTTTADVGAMRTKRAIDVVLSGVGLVLASPVLAATAVAVRLDSPGPVLFRQERVGKNGRIFQIRKFRTMRAGSSSVLVSSASDPRVTRVGATLRRSKLDELPQLLDVLQGHMSLVGPRPELAVYVALWPSAERELILSVRPGITDPATIELRQEIDELAAAADPDAYYIGELLPRKVRSYVEYVRTRSLAGDLRILGLTLRQVLTG